MPAPAANSLLASHSLTADSGEFFTRSYLHPCLPPQIIKCRDLCRFLESRPERKREERAERKEERSSSFASVLAPFFSSSSSLFFSFPFFPRAPRYGTVGLSREPDKSSSRGRPRDGYLRERASERGKPWPRRNVTRACSRATTCVWARGWALYATRVLYPHGNWNDARMIGCKWAAEKWRRETDRRRHDLLWLRRKNLRAGDRPGPRILRPLAAGWPRDAVVLLFSPRPPFLPPLCLKSSRDLQLRISFSWCFVEILRASVPFRFNRNWILSDRVGFTGQPRVMVDWSIIERLVFRCGSGWDTFRRRRYYIKKSGRQIGFRISEFE